MNIELELKKLIKTVLNDLDLEEEHTEPVQKLVNKRRQISLDLLHELDS